MINVEEIFCKVDDFYQGYELRLGKHLIKDDKRDHRRPELSPSEMMTIMILFHQSCFRHFKGFYTAYVSKFMLQEFPGLLSYTRFIQLLPRIVGPLAAFLESIKGRVTGLSFVDSTSLYPVRDFRL